MSGAAQAATQRWGRISRCYFRFVRSNDDNESFLCRLADEAEALADLTARSSKHGASLKLEGDRVRVAQN